MACNNTLVVIKDGKCEDSPFRQTSRSSCSMHVDGEDYTGDLSADRRTINWSDGDFWVREEIEESD